MDGREIQRIIGTLVLVAVVSPAMAGRWITPDWPPGQEPKYPPVPLYWFTVNECPLIYRTEVDVPKDATRATALLRTSGYVYVCVDGKQVYAWAPRAEDKQNKRPAEPADVNRVHGVDLSEHLTAGKHVLSVSAPAKGFVMDGAIHAGTRPLVTIESNEKWTVTKLAPTTIVEDEAVMKRGYSGPAVAVKAEQEWKADEDALVKGYVEATIKRLRRDLDDAIWRLELMAQKGIYIVDGEACGWGGPQRLPADFRATVSREMERAHEAADILEQVVRQPPTRASMVDPAWLRLQAVGYRVAGLRIEFLTMTAAGYDKATAKDLLASLHLPDSFDHPLNRLNESRYDRLGWLPHPGLTDGRIGNWGVRINPVTGPTKLKAPSRWLFATDANDAGEKELRWSIGYNIENQMDRIDVPRSWGQVEKYRNYRGVAWYRTRIEIPDEWAGNEVVLSLKTAGAEKLWVNDQEVTKLGTGAADAGGVTQRVYRLPASVIAFGAENFVAIKVDGRGEQRGIVGALEVSCPGLDRAEAKQTPAVDVLATPLSPCVVLTPKTDILEIHHAGRGRLVLPGVAAQQDGYQAEKHGKLKANWAILWLMPTTAAGVERPIELVFQGNPVSVECVEGMTRVTLKGPGQRVIAVRLWAKVMVKTTAEGVAEHAGVWSRAALAVPINYMSVTRVLRKGEAYDDISIDKMPKGPVLGQTVVYDYLLTKDEWGTEAMKIAPLPAMCSLAMDTKFRTLKIDDVEKVEVMQDGGIAGPYRAIRNSDRVSYSYEVEPYPRFIGFTSWMFSWADAGVPGNKREMETIAAIGANSYRPQHNWSDQRPGRYENGRWIGHFPETEKRTRVQITADECNAAGLNYMNNIEQTLDKHQLCREDYDAWLKTMLYPHFAKLVPQLKDRSFWAAAYDLVNEPFDHKAVKYNPAMRELTRQIRETDRKHLLYIEPCQAWGAIQQLRLIEPTGDPLTVYSFHDYNFRLNRAADRWPTVRMDISTICQMWWPAFEFPIKHGVPMHCGEFGGFDAQTDDSAAQTVLLNDFFKLFDQFGMHHHYYSGRGVYQRLADGGLRPGNVVRAYRQYLRRPGVNLYYGK